MKNKIRIAVIDDELSGRNKIKMFLKNHSVYEVVGDFSEPAKALEWLGENQVEIVLVDMNMPKITGVEFIKMTGSINPDIHFIAISGYEDFAYVKGCLQNDVLDYILKHQLTRESLIQVLDKAQKKYNLQNIENNFSKEEAIRKLFQEDLTSDVIEAEVTKNHLNIDLSDMVVFYLSPDIDINVNTQLEEYVTNLSMVLTDIVEQVIGSSHKYLIYTTARHNMAVLISFADIKSYQYIINMQTTMITRIQNMARRLLNITLSIGITSVCNNLKQAMKEYHQLKIMVEDKLYEGGEKVLLGVPKEKIDRGAYILSNDMKNRMEYELGLRNDKNIHEIIKVIFEEIKAVQCDRKDVEILCLRLLDVLKKVCKEQEIQGFDWDKLCGGIKYFQFIDQYQSYLMNCFEKGSFALKEMFANQYTPAVSRAVQYMNEFYNQEISLESCSDYIGMSYTHMSRLFKKETGKRFTEYLNQLRINKAKALIDENKFKMKEIVSQSGFNNYNYFFKVFKEVEGISPSEYMKTAKMCSNT